MGPAFTVLPPRNLGGAAVARVGRWEKQPTARGERWGAARVVVETAAFRVLGAGGGGGSMSGGCRGRLWAVVIRVVMVRPVAREHCQSGGAASSVVGAGDGGKEPGMVGGWWAGGGSRRPGCMAGTMGTGCVRKTTGAEKARGAEKVLL